MIRKKLIHPRKMVRFMQEFANEAHNLTYTSYNIPNTNDFTNAAEWFDHWQETELPRQTRVCKRKGFCAVDPEEFEAEEMLIGYNIEELYSEGHKQFRQDFIERYPSAKGFACVTLALLHEIGHFQTATMDFGEYDREQEIKFLKTIPHFLVNLFYFLLPDEQAATDWAIEWLKNPENRKKAKVFEKKFFSCFA